LKGQINDDPFQDDQCRYNPRTSGATDVGYTDIEEGNEEKLKEAVATIGPISVAIDASHQSFQFYSGGMLSCQGMNSYRCIFRVVKLHLSVPSYVHLSSCNNLGTAARIFITFGIGDVFISLLVQSDFG
jgi:hypothetical protein